jgi:hypothetical protein
VALQYRTLAGRRAHYSTRVKVRGKLQYTGWRKGGISVLCISWKKGTLKYQGWSKGEVTVY